MLVIGLTGKAGAGKSTAADTLVELGFTRLKMATPLKEMLRTLYVGMGLDPAEIERRIEGDLKELPDPFLCGQTPRHAMQTLGTQWGRDLIAQNFWTSTWTAMARSLSQTGDLPGIVVDDCRFPNEGDAIRAIGGVIVRIERPGLFPLASGHVSETYEIPASHVIINGADHDALARAVIKLRKDLGSTAHAAA